MIVEKLRPIKRNKELVAFSAKLDDTLPPLPDKLCRDMDGRMFFIKHVITFNQHPECQDSIILVIADVDRYLLEGDDVSIIDKNDKFYDDEPIYQNEPEPTRHHIPGGWWEYRGGEPRHHIHLCPTCGKDKNR
jgi:hypothetical protein